MELQTFKCSTCQIYLDGMANYQRHVNSLEHANRIHLNTLENITDENKVCCLSNGDSLPHASRFDTKVEESMDVSASMVCNSFLLKCELCQKHFTGNEPYRQHLESAGHKKKLDSNQNNHSDSRRCDICDKNFSGSIPYEQHMISSVHKKKLIDRELNQKENPLASFLTQCKPDTKSNVDLSGNPNQINSLQNASVQNSILGPRCDICDKNFSGPVPYNEHMSSNVHMKKLKEKEIVNNMQNNMCNTESTLHNMGDNLSFSPQSQLKCEVCDKTFTGPVPLQQHLNSLQHQKKAQAKKLFQKRPTTDSNDQVDSTSDDTNASVLPNSYTNFDNQTSELSEDLNKSHQVLSTNLIGSLLFKCDICDKSFTGRIPYDQHMISVAHQKKMLQKTNLPILSNGSPKNEMPLWFCKICEKQCSGSVPFTQHEMSDAHCKKMRMAEIEEYSQKMRDVNSTKSPLIAEHGSESCTDSNLVKPLGIETVRMSPKPHQTNSDLIMGDVLKDLNFITPETLNVTTFNVDEKIVFDAALR